MRQAEANRTMRLPLLELQRSMTKLPFRILAHLIIELDPRIVLRREPSDCIGGNP